MIYAKLIDNKLVFAPNPILVDGNWIGNPPGSVYEAEGYKPVQYTDTPETEGRLSGRFDKRIRYYGTL